MRRPLINSMLLLALPVLALVGARVWHLTVDHGGCGPCGHGDAACVAPAGVDAGAEDRCDAVHHGGGLCSDDPREERAPARDRRDGPEREDCDTCLLLATLTSPDAGGSCGVVDGWAPPADVTADAQRLVWDSRPGCVGLRGPPRA